MTEQETFKAGERVAAFNDHGRTLSLRTIDRITPTGIIVIGNDRYNPDGYMRGCSGYSHPFIQKLTAELQARAIREARLQVVKSFNLECLPDDELARLAGIINEIRKPAEAKKLFGKE